MKLSQRSLSKLQGVHPDLVKVVQLAIQKTTQDFSVTEGLRTLERQKQLFAQKATQTLNSKHLPQSTGYGHAVDLVPYPVDWNLEKFYPIVEAVRDAANELNVKIRWGGCWAVLNDTTANPKDLVNEYSANRRKQGRKPFIDGPHFELA